MSYLKDSESQTASSKRQTLFQKPAFYVSLGALCAVLSLVILPEIFATAAIILSAYACKFEGKRNWRLLIIALSVITMMVGIYYTAVFGLYSVLP